MTPAGHQGHLSLSTRQWSMCQQLLTQSCSALFHQTIWLWREYFSSSFILLPEVKSISTAVKTGLFWLILPFCVCKGERSWFPRISDTHCLHSLVNLCWYQSQGGKRKVPLMNPAFYLYPPILSLSTHCLMLCAPPWAHQGLGDAPNASDKRNWA